MPTPQHTPAAPESPPAKLPPLTYDELMRQSLEIAERGRAWMSIKAAVEELLKADVPQSLQHVQVRLDSGRPRVYGFWILLGDGSSALEEGFLADVTELTYSAGTQSFVATNRTDTRSLAQIVHDKLWEVERARLRQAEAAKRANRGTAVPG